MKIKIATDQAQYLCEESKLKKYKNKLTHQ